MGLAERHYVNRSNQPPHGPAWWRVRFWSMTGWLIAINIVVFLIDVASFGQLTYWGALSMPALVRMQLWRVISFQFLHAEPFHLIFNMFWLYYVGPMVEWRLGKGRFLAFYLICGLGGAAGFMILSLLRTSHGDHILVGASAGIFGVMVAAARAAPLTAIRLFLPPVTITLRTLTWIAIGLAAVTIYTGGFNAGGEAAHLGGAVIGFVLASHIGWLNVFDFRSRKKRSRFWRPGDPASQFIREDVFKG